MSTTVPNDGIAKETAVIYVISLFILVFSIIAMSIPMGTWPLGTNLITKVHKHICYVLENYVRLFQKWHKKF